MLTPPHLSSVRGQDWPFLGVEIEPKSALGAPSMTMTSVPNQTPHSIEIVCGENCHFFSTGSMSLDVLSFFSFLLSLLPSKTLRVCL